MRALKSRRGSRLCLALKHFLLRIGSLSTTTATATKTSRKKGSCAASNFIALILSHLIRQMLAIFFLEMNSKRLYRSSGKEEESRCIVFTSSTKCEGRHFHVVVVQWRQRNVQKSVMHVQSCRFANLNLLLLCRSRWRRCRHCLSSLLNGRVQLRYKLCNCGEEGGTKEPLRSGTYQFHNSLEEVTVRVPDRYAWNGR